MNDSIELNLLTRSRVEFSGLKLHKFDHRTLYCVHLVRALSLLYIFSCTAHIGLRRVLLDSVSEIIFSDVRVYSDQHICHTLLYGSDSLSTVANRMMLESTVGYIKNSKKFKV